jgi:hypothetical protein
MTGFAYVAGGTLGMDSTGTPLTTFTDPTCPLGDGQLTGGNGQGCTATAWTSAGDADAICITGTIPALTACPTNCSAADTDFDYTEDWGAQVGVAAGATATATIGGSYSSIAVTFIGTPGGSVRLQVNVGSTNYCVGNYVSGDVVPASSLVTDCYTTGGTPLPSLASVNQVVLSIVSAPVTETFTSFCMTGISFN